ncbi:MAG: Dam family site-specific DNA-(adenine-N6)-methyltransferase [Ignavibacteriales bacterium]|nr:Dam family site-specific DNA-(adenine-N6)-methyltransferase [Ignavibacteriales bacterium]
MSSQFLPRKIDKVCVPPIKCQGIKTKLVKFIASNISWHGQGRWIEPFLGSGVVLFNIEPARALATDSNVHIIQLYKGIQSGKINEIIAQQFLEEMGEQLKQRGEELYYEVRQRFNDHGDSLDFLFLNRSCFNGVIRFNSKGKFNVPYGHKPERFRQAYITKIVHQITWVRKVLRGKEWEFKVQNWRDTLSGLSPDDFAYLDPPYIGRHTDYYNGWTEDEAIVLADTAKSAPCGFALSMWLENKYRKNEHISRFWDGLAIKTFNHFYHVGSKETLRNEMIEALVIKPASVPTTHQVDSLSQPAQPVQTPLDLFHTV